MCTLAKYLSLIKTSREHISGNQNLGLARSELLDHMVTLFMAKTSLNTGALVAVSFQTLVQFTGTVPSAHKDYGLTKLFSCWEDSILQDINFCSRVRAMYLVLFDGIK